ncbi:MAG TPA: hypothetical protein VK629_06315 [Steroidobacteraceae bacterium]|nr:hypothetical protein [Steroidobacteraceae bacterium]
MKLSMFNYSIAPVIAMAIAIALSTTQRASAQDKPADPVPNAAPAAEQGAAKPPATTTGQTTTGQQRGSTRADRLDLDTTVVTGNRELPKVLYIVPWKKAEIGEMPAQPFNTLLDEVLQPVDRDVFKREVKYFHAINTPANADPKAKADVATTATSTAPPR